MNDEERHAGGSKYDNFNIELTSKENIRFMDTSRRIANLEVLGMTCTNCERHVAEALLSAGVTEASADHHRGVARFVWPMSASEEDLRNAVTEAGYKHGALTIE